MKCTQTRRHADGYLLITARVKGMGLGSWGEEGAANGSGIFSPSLDNRLRLAPGPLVLLPVKEQVAGCACRWGWGRGQRGVEVPAILSTLRQQSD